MIDSKLPNGSFKGKSEILFSSEINITAFVKEGLLQNDIELSFVYFVMA